MPRLPRMSKAKLSDKLTEVFLNYGYDGTSLAVLSDATGLSKASLYHHFPGGKEDMASYAMARLGARLQSTVIQPLSARGEPRARLTASINATRAYYTGDRPACIMNILGLGTGHTLFGAQLRDGVKAWTASLAKLLVDGGVARKTAERMAEATIGRIQGALVLCRVHASRSPLDDALDAIESELAAAISP